MSDPAQTMRQIGADLAEAGWSATRVARHLNVPRTTVCYWFDRGGEPGLFVGQRLLNLHVRVTMGKPVRAEWQRALA